MSEKHGGQSEQPDKIQSIIDDINSRRDKLEPLLKSKKTDDKEKIIIEKIESIERVGELDAKNQINFLVNHYDEKANGDFTPVELKKILKNFPNLKDEVISKIDSKIDEEKIPAKIKNLEKLKNKILK